MPVARGFGNSSAAVASQSGALAVGRPVHVSGHSWEPTQLKEARTWARMAKGPCLVQARAGPASGSSSAHVSRPPGQRWPCRGHLRGPHTPSSSPTLPGTAGFRQNEPPGGGAPALLPQPPERAANPHFTQELSCQATRGSILWDLFFTEHFKLANICTGLLPCLLCSRLHAKGCMCRAPEKLFSSS